MKFTTTLAVLLLSASTTILAAPVKLATRDVWVPKIFYPTAGTVWHAGEIHHVKWALDRKPVSVTNPVGKVLLSKNGLLDLGALTHHCEGGPETLNLPIFCFVSDHPLATGFQLTDGSVPVTIPWGTVPGSDYAVVRTYRFDPPPLHVKQVTPLAHSPISSLTVMGDSGNASPNFQILT